MISPDRIIELELQGRPVPYTRAVTAVTRDGRQRRVHDPRYRAWRTNAADAIRILRRGRKATGDIAVDIAVHPDRIVATFHTDGGPPRPRGLRGDLDNYAKAVLDAAQTAGLIVNDRDVTYITVRFPPKG